MRHHHSIIPGLILIAVAAWLTCVGVHCATVYTFPPTTQADGSVASAVVTVIPPVITPPVVTPPIQPVPPATQPIPPTTLPSGPIVLPTMPGQVYESDHWISTLPTLPNGFHDFSKIVPPNAIILTAPNLPAGSQASDQTTFSAAMSAAIANGSGWVLLRRGGQYPASIINNNFFGISGSASHLVGVGSIGANGINDYSLPRPVLLNGFGIAGSPKGGSQWGGPENYVAVFGLDFYGDQRDPSSPTYNKSFAGQVCALQLGDNQGAWGGSSSHILFEDIRARFFQKGFDVESSETYPLNTYILWRCIVPNSYGTFFGAYHYHVHDFTAYECAFDHNGWNATAAPKSDQQGREHGYYAAINPPAETVDPQNRWINCIFCQPDSCGIEANAGGLIDGCLFLSCPIAGYGAVYQTRIHNCVCDGGAGVNGQNEFDYGSMVGSGLTLVTPPPVPPKTDGNTRGRGLYLDVAPTGTIDSCLCINKPEVVNCQWALGVQVQDPAKQLPSVATVAAITNCKVLNWYAWNSNYPTPPGAPNTINVNPPPTPTITYSVDYFPGVTGINGVTATIPAYPDPMRTTSRFAQTDGFANAPAWMVAADNNNAANWDERFTATDAVSWEQAGFAVGQ